MTPPRRRPPTETWRCPVCDRPVEVESTPLAMKASGLWLPPSGRELVALCAVQNKAHGRSGRPVRQPEHDLPATDSRWQGVEWGPGEEGTRPLVVLVPPGVVLVPVGDGYDVVVLRGFEASDLVGTWDRLIASGVHRSHVAGDAVQLDPTGRMLDWSHFLSRAGSVLPPAQLS